ncbi:MAG: 4Fe-4S binding protein [Clostridiales bacterium]|nr:4Fe-4S binding protein [Clostridiales bacterium]
MDTASVELRFDDGTEISICTPGVDDEIPLSTDHEKDWSSQTKALFDACVQLGFQPTPTGKLVDFDRCVRCGRCVLGCRTETAESRCV